MPGFLIFGLIFLYMNTGLKIGKSFFLVVPLQVLAIKSCQNLKRYQKTNTFLLKPQEVPNKKKHNIMSWRPPGPKIGTSLFFVLFFFFWYLFRFWHFFDFFGTSSGFGNKVVPKPEEVPKKPKLFLQSLKRYQKQLSI